MVLPYTRVKTKVGFTHRPYLTVKLALGYKSVTTRGLVDSGSDLTLINKDFGKVLEVDFSKCRIGHATGIEGGEQKTWISTIDLEVENFPNSLRTIEVQFIESRSVGVLLGHKGFFENFSLKFDTYMLTFEIEYIEQNP